MKTDHWFYGLFQSAPDLIALLLPVPGAVVPSLGLDAPGDELYRFEAPELKAAEAGTPEQPVVLLEVQMHAKPGFKHRLGAQSFRFLQLNPQGMHLAVVVLVPHQRLKLGPDQLQAFLDGVIWLSLLTLPVRPEVELKASTQQILARRPDLLSTVLTMLIDLFSTLTLKKIMEIATIPVKDLRHTRAPSS